jgi:hypothetical protein
MTRREDFAALRKLVETMAPRPEQASARRLFEFYDEATAALRVIFKAAPPLSSAVGLSARMLAKLDEEIE